MRKIILMFLSASLILGTPKGLYAAQNPDKCNNSEINYWDFDSKSTEALNTSMIAWGIALFVGIALAAGLTNGPPPTNTPDLQ
jgi:hypothetical protein